MHTINRTQESTAVLALSCIDLLETVKFDIWVSGTTTLLNSESGRFNCPTFHTDFGGGVCLILLGYKFGTEWCKGEAIHLLMCKTVLS